MRSIYKIPLIAGAAVMAGIASITMGPVLLMIGSNTVAGIIMSGTSDEAFEDDFVGIPEVSLFIEKHPNHTTAHFGDFLGWKVIAYVTQVSDEKSIEMHVGKNVLHQGVRISAGCFGSGDQQHTLDIPQEEVVDFLQNDRCSGGQVWVPEL